MMKESSFYSEKKKWIPVLTLIYTSAHWFLFIATGRWWQSWLFWNTSKEALWDMTLQQGRPSLYWLMRFVEAFPGPVYRILTFFMFWTCMLLIYGILRNWMNLNRKACFWISALYSVIPAYDFRIIQGAFPYTLGLFLFMAGLFFFSSILVHGHMKWFYRVGLWAIFSFSFASCNSNLCFFGIVLLMIITKEKSIKILFTKYVDFVFLPIIVFIIKNKLFPVYGYFYDYNMVTPRGVVTTIFNTLPAAFLVMKRLLTNMIGINAKWLPMIALAILVGFTIQNFKTIRDAVSLRSGDKPLDMGDGTCLDIREDIIVFMYGVLILAAGIFAYVEVRGSFDIRTRGLDGRDAILVAFGASMIIYSIVVTLFRPRIAPYIFVFVIMCGIGFFNFYYLFYQRDHYYQLGFRYQLSRNYEEVVDLHKIVVHPNFDYGEIHQDELAQLDGNAAIVFGDKTRYFTYTVEDALNDDRIQMRKEWAWWNVDDFGLQNKEIDAVIEYSAYISLSDSLKMKVLELCNNDKFYEYLKNGTSMEIYYNGTQEFDDAIEFDIQRQKERENLSLKSGILNDEEYVLALLPEKQDLILEDCLCGINRSKPIGRLSEDEIYNYLEKYL